MRYTSRRAATRANIPTTSFGRRAAPGAADGQGSAPNLPRFLRETVGGNQEAEATASIAGAATSGGRPLPESLRWDFEIDDALDLSSVRIHDGADAGAVAAQKGARAFTVAQDIYFGSGQFSPGSDEGRRLLAHELTHTLQQRGNAHGIGSRGFDQLSVSEPGDQHEDEADMQAEAWLRGESPRVSQAPSAVLQRDPLPDATAPAAPATNPVGAAEAAAMQPPKYTDYFDQVIPGVLEAVEANGEVPYDRALWLITQARGEQGPLAVHADGSVTHPLPSEHHNRLFNEHATMQEDPKTHRSTPVPGQEHDGAHLYNLKQGEFIDGKWVESSSPTFGYDSATQSTQHHMALLKQRRPGVWNSLVKGGSFAGYVDALAASKYATNPDYVPLLKGLETTVAGEVSNWLRFRVPEMRSRIVQMEAYMLFLEENLAGWKLRLANEPDPVGENASQCASMQGLVRGMKIQMADVRANLARLERFAGGIKVKIPAAPPQG